MPEITDVWTESEDDKEIVHFMVDNTPIKISYDRVWTGELREMFYGTHADHVNEYDTDFPAEKMAEKMAEQLTEATRLSDTNDTVKNGIMAVADGL